MASPCTALEKRSYFWLVFILAATQSFQSCSMQKRLARSASHMMLQTAVLQAAHVGISIYEPSSGRYWFNYQGDRYFVPASNTKIPTCYAAMKYLGDSLTGLLYGYPDESSLAGNTIVIMPTGDPSFLHPDYPHQPAFEFLKNIPADRSNILYGIDNSRLSRWGSGWSWNDYEEYYMAERSQFPIFGNTITIGLRSIDERRSMMAEMQNGKRLRLFSTGVRYFDSLVNDADIPADIDRSEWLSAFPPIAITRNIDENKFIIEKGPGKFNGATITFATNGFQTALQILTDSLKRKFATVQQNAGGQFVIPGHVRPITVSRWLRIHTQPTDSVLTPMMHRSDNFLAEQCLLMVSRERLGIMNDEKIIDTLLQSDLRDLPQAPRWADGSGLSRYNLFSPQDFVVILNKMRTEFGMDRIKSIFATGGSGTLNHYYISDSGFIFAKTGTLSGVVALSGFLYTKKNKLLILSVLVNNHRGSATEVRRSVEKFVQYLRSGY